MTQLSPPSASKAAISLRYFLREQGFQVPLSVAQEALARTRGAASFQVLLAAEAQQSSQATAAAATPGLPDASRPTPLSLHILVRLDNPELLNEAVIEYMLGSTDMSLADKIGAVCIEQTYHRAYLRNDVLKVTVTPDEHDPEKIFLIRVDTELVDEQAIRDEVRRRKGALTAKHVSLHEALFQVICVDNYRDEPHDLGFEYVSHIPAR